MSRPSGAAGPPSGGVVRIPVTTPRFSPAAFGKAVWSFASGATGGGLTGRLRRAARERRIEELVHVNAMTFSPLTSRESGASHVFDVSGVRLVGHRKLPLSIAWSEVGRVALQVQHSRMLGLKSLRLIVWPLDHKAFAAAHPDYGVLWDPEIGGYSLNLSTGPVISQTTIDLAVVGLSHAAERFSGQVDEVHLPDQRGPQGP